MTDVLAIATIDRLRNIGATIGGDAATDLQTNGSLILRESSTSLLIVGIPDLPLATQQAWLGGVVLGIWPRSAFDSQRLTIVSSRLTRKLGQHANWFDAFRTLVCQVDPDRQVLLTADGTTADRFVRRASKLFDFPLCSIEFADHEPETLIDTFDDEPTPAAAIQLSLPIHKAVRSEVNNGPRADMALVALANQVRALRVTSGSQTESLLLQRLGGSGFPPASVHVSSEAQAESALTERGAIPRIFLRPTTEPDVEQSRSNKACLTKPPFDDYLLHWTRSPDGPWPDEQPDDYIDSLILGVEATDRTAFAALSRILKTGRLLASSHLIRGGFEVVCFSDVAIEVLPQRRVYRRHLRRWDFESYGIGIRKSVLTELGAKPVVYGDVESFDQLGAEQPFFQLATSTSGSNWRDEQEWRIVGDVPLSNLSPEDVFLFSPSEAEATALAAMSDWPAVVIPSAVD